MAILALAAAGVVLGGALWLVTIPLLPRATATSLALTTAWVGFQVFEGALIERRPWRETLIGGAALFVVLWPLTWLLVSYESRR